MCGLKCGGISSDGQKRSSDVFLKTGVLIFLKDNQPFNYPSETLVANFSERKNMEFFCVQINGDMGIL